MPRQMLMALGMVLLTACAQTDAIAPQEPAANIPARENARTHETLNRLVGRWVLTGTIAGQDTVHDIEADWVLQGNYVRLNEVSRERGENGLPAYEATVFIGWLESAHQYVCIWLDNTEVASGEVTCSAADTQDTIALEFRNARGALIFTNTFVYHARTDTWDWQMDNIRGTAAEPFARVILRRP